ncbi:CRISPR-associated endoribonuclease Cas6 [Listeria grandensis]|uniref:CRISPR-associated endoribonuclease Cas6 n=1 Tax=Listeria grandensis TaxID=1494963 RepID=A0A7X0Y4I3_9LIST|nr:CRISPR-associated endoribonuclease Cas6 [Listeria grandensis]MBC1475731.1 CRISPR-associated endoribonuclease Cas6 [Listeria grandensis]MBC1936816.1 CRISPR-associated endoribonuclease Cas6 [Listeria grandensis]
MRLKIVCRLDNEVMPLDYRSKIVMILKKGLAKKHPDIFKTLYETNKQKDFTFAVYFKGAKFTNKEIIVSGRELIINFSTGNAQLAIPFYNAFTSLKWQEIKISDGCHLQIQKVDVMREKEIKDESVIFKTLSPIVCRDHDQETYKDWFYDYSDADFEKLLKRNFYSKLQDRYGDFLSEDIEKLSIVPIDMKKTVVLHYDLYVACSIGILEIKAPKYMLDYIASCGLGSVTGMGFGMLEQA